MKKIMIILAVVATLLVSVVMLTGAGMVKKQDGTDAERAVLKAAVHVASSGLAGIAVKADGTCDVDTIRNFVHAARFLDDKTGYFYVYDSTNNFCVAHAMLRDFEGKDKSDFTDSRGMKIAQKFAETVTATPTGDYLVFYWMNPKDNIEEKKLGYAEMIPGTKLYIGSGIFVK